MSKEIARFGLVLAVVNAVVTGPASCVGCESQVAVVEYSCEVEYRSRVSEVLAEVVAVYTVAFSVADMIWAPSIAVGSPACQYSRSVLAPSYPTPIASADEAPEIFVVGYSDSTSAYAFQVGPTEYVGSRYTGNFVPLSASRALGALRCSTPPA